jgi:hypothetical protein
MPKLVSVKLSPYICEYTMETRLLPSSLSLSLSLYADWYTSIKILDISASPSSNKAVNWISKKHDWMEVRNVKFPEAVIVQINGVQWRHWMKQRHGESEFNSDLLFPLKPIHHVQAHGNTADPDAKSGICSGDHAVWSRLLIGSIRHSTDNSINTSTTYDKSRYDGQGM